MRDRDQLISLAIDAAEDADDVIVRYVEGRDGQIRFSNGQIDIAKGSDDVFLTLMEGEVHRLDDETPDVFVTGAFKKLTLKLGDRTRIDTTFLFTRLIDPESDRQIFRNRIIF